VHVHACYVFDASYTKQSVNFYFFMASMCREHGHVTVEKEREEPHCDVRKAHKEEKNKKDIILTCIGICSIYSAAAGYII